MGREYKGRLGENPQRAREIRAQVAGFIVALVVGGFFFLGGPGNINGVHFLIAGAAGGATWLGAMIFG